MTVWTERDPFAGVIDVTGETLEEALAEAYRDITEADRPAYVWHRGQRLPVPGGRCRPVQ